MHILALDQSLTISGYSIFHIQNNSYSLVEVGFFKHNTKLDYFDRILSCEHLLDEVIADYSIDYLVIEDIHKQPKVSLSTYKKLTALQFFLQYYAFYRKIDCQIISVSTWRSHFKKAFKLPCISKETVFEFLNEYLDCPEDLTNHHTDSIGIGLCFCQRHLNILNGNIKYPKIIT